MKKLLAIAIPTYNRSEFLDRSLRYFSDQTINQDFDIELLISDNCSTDNTFEIVQKYREKYSWIKYIKNPENIGVDRNVIQCFEKSEGKFVWIMGDDDYLIPGALSHIYKLLNENQEIGLCYLSSKWVINSKSYSSENINKINWTTEIDSLEFFKKINYWTTFLSGNIVSKKLLGNSENYLKYVGTNLPQILWVFPAIFLSNQNIYVQTEVLICQSDNSGGYGLVKVFGVNFSKIINEFIDKGYNPKIRDIIADNLLISFFPRFVEAGKLSKKNYFELFKLFGFRTQFWNNIIGYQIAISLKKKVVFMKSNIKQKLSIILYKILNSPEFRQLELKSIISVNNNGACFKSIGVNPYLPIELIVKNPQYMVIGNDFSAMKNLRLEAWDEYMGQKFTPKLFIGNNVKISTDVHIGVIDEIRIGNNVLMASRIYISDHFHGDTSNESLHLPPLERPLLSKGPVIIEDSVWIGEGVCIMPGVIIGRNSIIGANAVVTKSIPPFSIAVGIPAQIIKTRF